MQGQIWIRSDGIGKGATTTMVVRLGLQPLSPLVANTSGERASTTAHEAAALHGLRVSEFIRFSTLRTAPTLRKKELLFGNLCLALSRTTGHQFCFTLFAPNKSEDQFYERSQGSQVGREGKLQKKS